MSTSNEGGAEQENETYDAVVEDLNFDPANPDVQPHPDHPGPGAHSSHDEGPGDATTTQDDRDQHPQS